MEASLCVSYPKAGRTWLRVLMDDLGVGMEFTHFDTGADKKSWGKRHSDLEPPRASRDKVIFLHRDPRDTVVSFFHQMTKRQRPIPCGRKLRFLLTGRMPPTSMDAFVRSPRFGIEKTVVFNLRCAAHLRAYVVAYEQMIKNPTGRLSSILSYLGRDIPEETIRSVVANNSFDRMRAREAAGELAADYGNKLTPSNPRDSNSFKVRRGRVGGWTDEMEPKTREFANELLRRYRYWERMRELTGMANIHSAA